VTDQQTEHDRIEAEIGRKADSRDPFAAAVRATRMPMLITDPARPDNPIVFCNDAFSKLTGYSRAEILGHNCRFLQGEETDRQAVADIRDAIERRVSIEVELLNYKKNGERFWNRLLISPVFDDEGQVTYFFASQFDVTLERERLVHLLRDRTALEAEAEKRATDLSRSEERLRFIMKAGRFGAWTLDLGTKRLVASSLCKENFGRAETDPFTYDDLVGSILPEDRPRVDEAVTRCIAEGEDYDIEYHIRTPAGERRWVHVRGQPTYGADGTPLTMAGVSLDITDRKRAEEHRTMLSAELDHRVKNSMANIQSIANQTLQNAVSLDDARVTLGSRLSSLARAHDVLTGEAWSGATLYEIVSQALQPFRSGRQRFRFGGPDVRLTPRLSLSFILALHELATNAVKYGALSNDKGFVLLNWEVEGERLSLRWEEVDGPAVTPPERSGFGTKMIERALAVEAGGSARIDYRPRGVVFTLEAPVPVITPTSAGSEGTGDA
jgi:PAS domain S-box-containing protein